MSQRRGEAPRGEYLKQQPLLLLHLLALHDLKHSTTEWTTFYLDLLLLPSNTYSHPSEIPWAPLLSAEINLLDLTLLYLDLTLPYLQLMSSYLLSTIILTLSSLDVLLYLYSTLTYLHLHSMVPTTSSILPLPHSPAVSRPLSLSSYHHHPNISIYSTFHVSTPTRFLPE
jgi:hypothetical protein